MFFFIFFELSCHSLLHEVRGTRKMRRAMRRQTSKKELWIFWMFAFGKNSSDKNNKLQFQQKHGERRRKSSAGEDVKTAALADER